MNIKILEEIGTQNEKTYQVEGKQFNLLVKQLFEFLEANLNLQSVPYLTSKDLLLKT